MSVLYNDNEKFAAAVLRRAIHAGIVAPGKVGARSIVDVDPASLSSYTHPQTM